MAVCHLVVKFGARSNAFGSKFIKRFYECPIDAALLLASFSLPKADGFVLHPATHRRVALEPG
jgi:hypothetical protein